MESTTLSLSLKRIIASTTHEVRSTPWRSEQDGNPLNKDDMGFAILK